MCYMMIANNCFLTNFNFLQHNAEPEAVDLLMEVISHILFWSFQTYSDSDLNDIFM